MRQNEKRMQNNKHAKSTLKTYIKNFLKSLDEKKDDTTKSALDKTISALSKAASKRVIHKRNASRKISRLTRKYNSLVQSGQ